MSLVQRCFIAFLAVLFLLLQFDLWVSHNGVARLLQLKQQIAAQQIENQHFEVRNQKLAAEIALLKEGNSAVEAHARLDLGMIKSGETYYQIVVPKSQVQSMR